MADVRRRIAAAAVAASRNAEDVRLVAVTKYVDAATTQLLVEAGCRDLGESRPQQLWDKAATLADPNIRWHMIGHLQRNKVRRTVELLHLLHSGDSLRLLQEVDETCAKRPSPLPVLLEVNVSGDSSKHGLTPSEVEPLLDELAKLTHLDVRGLMCMAGLDGDAGEARRDFAALRTLRDRLRLAWEGRYTLDDLSMGMSGDFEVAVAEGSTMVRVGSALFE
ncbi:MAG: YggS family pyridoxal phosphate-dependent enzyme [Pirellulales bacterium]